MKKLLIATLIMLSVSVQTSKSAELFESPEDLENFNHRFYEAPVAPIPEVTYEDDEYDYNRFNKRYTNPMFKKLRIRLTNIYRTRVHNQELKEIEKEKKRFEQEFQQEGFYSEDYGEVKVKADSKSSEDTSSIKDAINSEIKGEDAVASKPIELSGNVKQLVVPKDLKMDCDKMEYFEDRNEIEAIGNAFLEFPAQKVTLKADKFVYNMSSNILKAYDNVEVTKDGKVIKGDYTQINMNEENAFMDNVSSIMQYMTLNAKKASTESDLLILKDGRFYSDKSHKLFLRTKMVGADLSQMMINEDDKSYFEAVDETSATLRIDATKILVDAHKNHNKITLQDADVYYKGRSLFTIPSLTAYTNKNNDYFEANYPEFGSIPRLGMFVGPGFVFMTPFDSTVKVVPMLNYKNKIGVGGIVRYKSATNMTDIAYGTSSDLWVIKGRQRLDDNFYLQYGMNAYLDDWFMGSRMGKYAAEFIYEDRNRHKDFLGKGKDMRFRHRIGAGYMHDSDINRHGEKINSAQIGTTRLKYMAEIDQSLYRYVDKENLKMFDFGVSLQGSAAVYGTGDTQFLGRIGPRIHSQYKYWMQDIGYYLSAYDDHSPLPRYDMYRYGKSNVYLREALRVNKYLTVAWAGSLNLSDDAPNDKMFQENAFIVSLGPDECKLSLGYDFIRNRTYFNVMINMDTKGSSVEFDRMEIKNPDKLSKSNDEEELVNYEEAGPIKPKDLQYATVIQLEDPDKEKL